MATTQPAILIVDDFPGHIDLLGDILEGDYDVLVASNGRDALKIALDQVPDLILLDVLMPEMDGYEVCRQLKADEKTREIPVIFITTQGNVRDETRGFQMGAVDYVTKPISPPILRARVKTHIALRTASVALQRKNAELSDANDLRTKVEAFLSHDLQSPLSGIFGYADFLLENDPSPEQVRKYGQFIKERALRLFHLLKESSNLMKMEQDQYPIELKPFDLLPIIRWVLADTENLAQKKQITRHIRLQGVAVEPGQRFMAKGEESLCYILFSNLIKNALEASPPGESVTVSLTKNDWAVVAIHNIGTVPAAIQDRFFDKYVTAGKAGGTGLGIYSALWMTKTQKGTIHMESTDQHGTTLTVQLANGHGSN